MRRGRRRRLSLAAGMVWHTKHPADATGPHRAWALAAQSPANQRAPPTQSGREGRFAGSAALVRGSRPGRGDSAGASSMARVKMLRRFSWRRLGWQASLLLHFAKPGFFSRGRPRQLIWEGELGFGSAWDARRGCGRRLPSSRSAPDLARALVLDMVFRDQFFDELIH
ncbi:hypothetical protein ACCO45_007638 [Purpureocillium lilacinum]|uniref:Uncharacterized protein n=1 Tax=Purpureocillium lilacinum TaxID=33203 RepID=A0ACC4DL16_PURLI